MDRQWILKLVNRQGQQTWCNQNVILHTHQFHPMTDYAFPSASNMDYTPPIVQPDDFLSNIFGIDCGTPTSTRGYMHSL